MNKQLLVIGIDPGTTVGYAIFSIEGSLVEKGSSKLITPASLTEIIILHGKPVIVCTDKKRTPDYADKLAIRLGCRIINPDEDLHSREKKDLASPYDCRNDHEEDAVASCIYALGKMRHLLGQIHHFLDKKQKMQFFQNMAELMILYPDLNMMHCLELLEQPDQTEHIIMKKVLEEKLYTKKDYMNLFRKLKEEQYHKSSLLSSKKKLLQNRKS